ncbi:hypothetical protein HMI55_006041 [Coelomomyces lativittatus]|nr:hypothetical protein HMI55_006041 [Coelomomyces lativittatus]
MMNQLIYCSKLYKERFSLLRPKPTGHSEVHGHGSSTHHRKLLENEYDPVSDLIETIDQLIHHTILCAPKSIVSIFLDEKVGILRKLERARNRKEVKEFVSAVAWFNKEYARCKKEGYVIGYHKKRYDQKGLRGSWFNCIFILFYIEYIQRNQNA